MFCWVATVIQLLGSQFRGLIKEPLSRRIERVSNKDKFLTSYMVNRTLTLGGKGGLILFFPLNKNNKALLVASKKKDKWLYQLKKTNILIVS